MSMTALPIEPAGNGSAMSLCATRLLFVSDLRAGLGGNFSRSCSVLPYTGHQETAEIEEMLKMVSHM